MRSKLKKRFPGHLGYKSVVLKMLVRPPRIPSGDGNLPHRGLKYETRSGEATKNPQWGWQPNYSVVKVLNNHRVRPPRIPSGDGNLVAFLALVS